MKTFPIKFEAAKKVLFYPEEPDTCVGDILEVGPGRGDLLLSLATLFPEKRFVAIELGKKRYYKLPSRIEKKQLDNILLIQGDARIVLPKYFKKSAFEKIYVLFPDPWPKIRHAPKRLLNAQFLTLLAQFLRPGGDLFMATDVTAYAEWVVENAAGMPILQNLGRPFVDGCDLADYEPTFFEMKWRSEGRPIFYLWYRRESK
ncbi:MAG: hypothetical protein ABII79_00715 [bacterium]